MPPKKNRKSEKKKRNQVGVNPEKRNERKNDINDPAYQEKLDTVFKLLTSPTFAAEKKQQVLDTLDEEFITDLRCMHGPYSKKNTTQVVEGERRLLFSFIDMDKEYKQRLIMTGLIAFIHRMTDEFEHASADDLPSENDTSFSKEFDRIADVFMQEKPVQVIEAEVAEAKSDTERLRARAKLAMFIIKRNRAVLKKSRKAQKTAEAKKQELMARLDAETAQLAKVDEERKRAENPEEERRKEREYTEALLAKTWKGPPFAPVRKMHVINNDIHAFRQKIADLRQDIAAAELSIKETFVDRHEALAAETGKQESELAIFREAFYDFQAEGIDRSIPKSIALQNIFSDMKVEFGDMTEEDEFHIRAETKARLGIKQTKEERQDEVRELIDDFLKHYFSFNPDQHVKSSYAPNYVDPERKPIPEDADPDEDPARAIIPPADTHARFNRYFDANYEYLRQATDDIYPHKCDVDSVFIAHTVITNKPGKDMATASAEWQRKHASEVDLDILDIDFNKFVFMGPWAQNRERINFYTKDTEVLKRIMDASRDHDRMGRDLMKKRVQTKKKENIRRDGPDAPAMSKIREANPIKQYGAKPITSPEDIPRDEQKLGEDEIKVDVHHLSARRRGKRIQGRASKWKFHIPAEKPKEDSVKPLTPGDVRQEIDKREADGTTGDQEPIF